jgi:UDP-hydrolysing UDP-N-acetyl-D-glucosamine 2-epimerase
MINKQFRKHIVYVSGSRADYGLMKNTLSEIVKHPVLRLSVVVTGMHLLPEFGMTINEIIKDGKEQGFETIKLDATYHNDERASMAEFVGKAIVEITKVFKNLKPDILLLIGDRGEMLAGAVAGTYLGIPIAHVHGGEVSSTVDEVARHAITKLAHIHLASTNESAERIIKMGEEKKNVHMIGAPGLDEIIKFSMKRSELEKKIGVKLADKFVIVAQHPVSAEISHAKEQMRETIEAVLSAGLQIIIIYPNADAGGRAMIEVIEQYNNNPSINIFKSLKRDEFLGLMKYASVMVGNSSSGIIEAASFKLPVVNVGTRQQGRQRACNVIDADCDRKKILAAIKKALNDKNFRLALSKCKNPYGDGKTSQRIAKLLAEIKINKEFLQKRITY